MKRRISIIFIALLLLLMATCQRNETDVPPTLSFTATTNLIAATQPAAVSTVPVPEPSKAVHPTNTLPSATVIPSDSVPASCTSPCYPLQLPSGVNNVLVYASSRSTGSYSPPAGELLYISLDAEGQPLGTSQLWLETPNIAGLYPSPDGKLLAIVVSGESGSFAWVVDPKSGEFPYPIPSSMETAFVTVFLGWAADSSGVIHTVDDFVGDSSIILVGRDTQTLAESSDDHTSMGATVSPDGQTLIYSLSDKTWRRDLQTQTTELLLDSNICHPVWSPDGQWIAFFARSNLKLMRPDGGEVRLLSDKSASDCTSFPAWAPNGDGLAFMTKDHEFTAYLASVDAQGAAVPRLVVPSTESSYLDPSWSPDGNHLLIIGGSDDDADIWLVDRDGKGIRQLTFDGGHKRYPVWLELNQR